MSEEILKNIFQNFFEDKDKKKLLRILLIGEMETGKTTISTRLFEIIREIEEIKPVYTTATNIKDILPEITNSRKKLFILLDDPNYDEIAKNKLEISKYISQIRHKTNNDTIIALISHGIKLLPPLIRNADIKIFTSTFNNNYENEEIEMELGTYYYEQLEKITLYKKIYRKAKGKAILKVIGMKPRIIEFKKPSINLSEWQKNTKEKVIYLQDDLDRQILELRLKGKKIVEIAKIVNRTPGRITRRLQKIMKEL